MRLETIQDGASSNLHPPVSRPPGRPRSEQARRAILGAAVRLVEKEGYGALTVEGIARSAGVSKQTVYRWWPSKADVVLEALNEGAERVAPEPDTGALESDLRPFVRRSVTGARRNADMLAALMAESQLDEDFAASFRSGFLARRRAVLRQLLERARERGELAESADIDFIAEVVFGTLWYRILNRHAPLNQRFADELNSAVLDLVRE
jgi:AcrR family transcriptional regulator